MGARGSPEAPVQAVEQYLLSHYSYSLTTRLAAGDPISRFLLTAHSGHCQYFAASAVMLLRCLGVPARYVSGYYGHEINSGGAMVVRQQDAHAWTEAWIEGKGWITVDTTPADGRPDHTGTAVSAWQKLRERFQDAMAALKYWLTHLQRRIVIELLAGLGAFFVVVKAWQSRRRAQAAASITFAYAGAGSELDSLARRFEKVLQDAGMPCPPSLPWQEHLAAWLKLAAAPGPATAIDGIDFGAAAAFVSGYNALRFGGPGDPAAMERLRERLRELEGGSGCGS